MDDDRQIQLRRHVQLPAEHLLLELLRRVLRPVVIQADLADGHHFFMAAQRPDGVKTGVRAPGAVLRVDAHGGVDMGVLLRQGHGPAGALHIAARVHHQTDAASRQGGEDLVPVGVEAAGVVMGMGIENGHENTSHCFLYRILSHSLKRKRSRM